MYKLTRNPNEVIKLSDGATIPKGSRNWKEYQDWIAEGNTPDPAETAQEIKDRLYGVCDGKALALIQVAMPDWMDRRHREQKDLVARGKRPDTKLPEATWETNQEVCDEIRDASDIVTDQIENSTLTTEDEVINHIAWP